MSAANSEKTVFITGSSGYMGKRLIRILLHRGHKVIALVRKGSEHKIPAGASVVSCDPFDAVQLSARIPANAVVVQLLGVAHPSPRKANQFREIDLRSVIATATAAATAGAQHFIYVSVAMAPSKLMAAYQAVRREGEQYILQQKLNSTFLRPWYVLGPGHWWPVILYPFYAIAELIPAWRKQARSKALVTIKQMVRTLVNAVEAEPQATRIVEIKKIRDTHITG